MNKQRLKKINNANNKLDLLAQALGDLADGGFNAEERVKAQAAIGDSQAVFEEALNEEQEYFDNMPEGLQGSEKGEIAEANISSLEAAIEALRNKEMEQSGLMKTLKNIQTLAKNL
jgi:hypothetical protein